MQRNILIGVAVLAVLALVLALGLKGADLFGGLPGRHKDVPTVMIITQELLESRINAATKEEEQQNAWLQQIAAKSTPAKDGAAKPKEPDAKPPAPSEAMDAHKQASNMTMIVGTLKDPLAGTLGHDFQASGRFNVVAGPVVIDAMEAYGKGASDRMDTVIGKFSRAITGTAKKPAKDPAPTDKTAVTQVAQIDTHGLSQIARKVGADYILIVTTTVPTYSVDAVNSSQLSVTAQPIVSYEIFDAGKGQKSFRRSEQLAKPLVETINISGASIRDNALASLYRLQSKLNHSVSQFVLANVLQEIAPARITRAGSQIVINRGANDGVREGAVYDVERETGDVEKEGVNDQGKGGRSLERVRTPVGQVRIDRVQDRIAIGSVASGGPFSRNDVVIFSTRTAGSPVGGASAATNGVALGSRALSQADLTKSGVTRRQASVAIDQIVVTQGGHAIDSAPLSRALASALQQDRRITVLSRKDLDQVMQERRINAAAQGETGQPLAEGLDTAGYVIVGEFTSSTSRHENKVSLGDVSRTVSVSSSTQLSGTLRALSTNGALVESVQVSVNGGGLDNLAKTAARAMLLKLFPMKVVQVDAGQGVIRLNRGEDAGLQAGSHVRIYSLGERIVDPQTGTLLSEGARTYVGEIVLTQVDPAVSTGRFAGAPFAVAVGYDALIGAAPATPAAASAPATGGKRPAAPKAAKAKPERELNW